MVGRATIVMCAQIKASVGLDEIEIVEVEGDNCTNINFNWSSNN